VQYEFFVDALRRRIDDEPSLAQRAEFAAVLANDAARLADLGLPRVALALAGLFEGATPEEFAAAVQSFIAGAVHSSGRPMRAITYKPMLELLAALRSLEFTIAIVSGGGAEFVRAISDAMYDVPPELVVGTLIAYEFKRDTEGRPALRRTAQIIGDANEGTTKVTNIQTQLGRPPIFAAGNSAGDREMLEWARDTAHPSLALLIDHDDADREYAYASEAATMSESQAITDIGQVLGWTIVSMARDWQQVFQTEPE
jgi:phosphoserine phosphatase